MGKTRKDTMNYLTNTKVYRSGISQKHMRRIRTIGCHISPDLNNRSVNLHFMTGNENMSTFIVQIEFQDLSLVAKTCLDVLGAQEPKPQPLQPLA